MLINKQKIAMSTLNRFFVAVHLLSNRLQMMSKCGKNKEVACKSQLSVSLIQMYTYCIMTPSVIYHGNIESTCFNVIKKQKNFKPYSPYCQPYKSYCIMLVQKI